MIIKATTITNTITYSGLKDTLLLDASLNLVIPAVDVGIEILLSLDIFLLT